jgi:hypothetical protein
MSMVDESPSIFIKEGKIYRHHEGSSYTSGGFTDYEPSWDSELCDATPRNINHYLKQGSIYNYETHKNQEHIPSDYKAAFGKELFEGDEVYVVYTDYSDRFGGYMKCKITGFTKLFAKLKVITASKKYLITDKPILRLPHRLILI